MKRRSAAIPTKHFPREICRGSTTKSCESSITRAKYVIASATYGTTGQDIPRAVIDSIIYRDSLSLLGISISKRLAAESRGS